MSLSGGNGIRLLLHLHAVADVLGQPQDGALIQVIVFEEICTVPFGLFGRLIEKVLHIGTHGFALHRFTAGKPEVTAEMVSGAEPLFNQRQLPRGIQTAAETAFHIIPVLVFAVAGFQLRAKRIGRPHHAVFSGCRRAVNGQIVGADHFGREQLGQQRHPSLPEMEGERLFCMGSAVKAQIFPEGCPYCLCQFLTAQRMVTARSSAVFVLSVVSAQSQAADLLFPVRGTGIGASQDDH